MPSRMETYEKYLNRGLQVTEPVVKDVIETNKGDKHNKYSLDMRERKYDRQFSSMYKHRSQQLCARAARAAAEKWGNGDQIIDGKQVIHVPKILDIESGQVCWVVGTVFCDLKHKLNILRDVEHGLDDVIPAMPQLYVGTTESDTADAFNAVMLEDESGRALLHNDSFLADNGLVTGCVVAVLGMEVDAGVFEIMDVAYPEPAPQRPLTLTSTGKKVAIVSGLNIGNADSIADLRLDILSQMLAGELGLAEERLVMRNVVTLVIAGDSVKPLLDSSGDNGDSRHLDNYGSKNVSRFNTEGLQKLDRFVHDILLHTPVAIMPGWNDPSEVSLPQQPLHPLILSSNRTQRHRLERCTNPQWFELQGRRILGCSGQNVRDVSRYSTRPTCATKIMERMVNWQHFMPTAPDTLYCYPYDDCDPFMFDDETPHLLFAGNQDSYALGEYRNGDISTKLVSSPRFSDNGEIVLLDLDTLETLVIRIEL